MTTPIEALRELARIVRLRCNVGNAAYEQQAEEALVGASYALAAAEKAEPVAWLLRPIVQRNPDRPIIRGCYTTPRTEQDYEFAALDGDEYIPLYAAPKATP